MLAALALVCCGCGPDPGTPEDQVRRLFDEAEFAVEDRDLGRLREMIAEDYSDRYGHDKYAIENLLRAYFFRHGSIHLLTRVESIEFPGTDYAEATLLVGMADTARDTFGADVYQLNVRLVDRGDAEWQVVGAQWQRGLGEQAR